MQELASLGGLASAVGGEGRVGGETRGEGVVGCVGAGVGVEGPGEAVTMPEEEDLGDYHAAVWRNMGIIRAEVGVMTDEEG